DLSDGTNTEVPAVTNSHTLTDTITFAGHRVAVGGSWFDATTRAFGPPPRPFPPGALACGAHACMTSVWPCVGGHPCPADATVSWWDPATGALRKITDVMAPVWVHVTDSGWAMWQSEGFVWASDGPGNVTEIFAAYVCAATASEHVLLTYESSGKDRGKG